MQLPASHQSGPKPSSAQSPGAKTLLSLGQLSQVPSGLHGLTCRVRTQADQDPGAGWAGTRLLGPPYGSSPPRITRPRVVLTLDSGAGLSTRVCLLFSLCLIRFWFTIHRDFVFIHLFISLALSVMFISLYFSPSISPLHPPSVLS